MSCVSICHCWAVTWKCQDFQESQRTLARYEKMVMDVGRTYGKKRKRPPNSKCAWQTLAEALAVEVSTWESTTTGYRKKGGRWSLVSEPYSVFAKTFRVCGELQTVPKQVLHLRMITCWWRKSMYKLHWHSQFYCFETSLPPLFSCTSEQISSG